MRHMQGDFALQTRCTSVPAERSLEKPALGGVLLWHNLRNFLRLDWGSRGLGEITFLGCINREDVVVGRGRLCSTAAYLRLERIGNAVRALCSENGDEWYTAGQVEFPIADPLEVGLYAIGNIDRALYHGAFPDGTAIRFSDVELWSSL
jgi:hypothetical protein